MSGIEKIIERALKTIIDAKRGLIDKEEAFDALWEYLMNIDYELQTKYRVRNHREIFNKN
ncbi:MAG: hypothetical protein ACP5NQ_03980 [Vulcanisaeta sp.]